MTLPELIALARKATDLHKITVPDRHDNPTEIVDMSWVQEERALMDRLLERYLALAEVAEAAKEMKETIAANRLMLGHHMGVEWLHREEKSWDASLSRLPPHETGDKK